MKYKKETLFFIANTIISFSYAFARNRITHNLKNGINNIEIFNKICISSNILFSILLLLIVVLCKKTLYLHEKLFYINSLSLSLIIIKEIIIQIVLQPTLKLNVICYEIVSYLIFVNIIFFILYTGFLFRNKQTYKKITS